MKKLVIFCAVLLLQTVFCFAADPVEGYWVSVDDKTGKITAGWEMYVVDGKLYGKMHSMADVPQDLVAVKCKETYKGFPVAGKVNELIIIGTPWIFGLTSQKPGQWRGGFIVDPSTGNMYNCKITFRAADGKKFPVDVLEMRGELIGLGIIGGSQYWRKSTLEEASGLR
ncbi:hypothetical protein AGMMS49991_02330 [Spirochaetia bacterium]|nr:hypothetical protein AGMMS49991_02330 [Spirochaetia bacterium]